MKTKNDTSHLKINKIKLENFVSTHFFLILSWILKLSKSTDTCYKAHKTTTTIIRRFQFTKSYTNFHFYKKKIEENKDLIILTIFLFGQ